MSYEEKDRKFARSEEHKALSESMQSLSSSDPSPDQELKSVLQHWSAPSAPAKLDTRVMATYRRHVAHRSWWRLTSFRQISLPARLAVGASLCLLAFVLFQRSSSHRIPVAGQAPQSLTIEGTDVEISGGEPRYITYVSGSGFQPVRPVKIQINRGSDQDEN